MNKPDDLHYPIILLLDSSSREQTKLAIIIDGEVKELFSQSRAQELPKLIEELLKREKLPPSKLRAIAVITQGESLTGVRIGITTANTLAWQWKIPVLKIDRPGFEQAIQTLSSNKHIRADKAITDSI